MIHVFHADLRDHDTLELLCSLSFAAMIVDPPYAPRVHKRAISAGTNGAGPHERDLGFDSLDPRLRGAIATLASSTKRWTTVCSDIETAHLWHEALEAKSLEYVRTVPWIRWSQPQLSGDRPPSGCELITLAHPPVRKHWSGPGSLTAFDTRSLRGATKYSCEKPLDLMLSLVSWFSDAGESVCDPCCGSGTTGLACRLLGREAVLIDNKLEAVTLARERTTAPLSSRDRERCERWIEYQRAWLTGEAPTTEAGAARYARASADTDAVCSALKP